MGLKFGQTEKFKSIFRFARYAIDKGRGRERESEKKKGRNKKEKRNEQKERQLKKINGKLENRG